MSIENKATTSIKSQNLSAALAQDSVNRLKSILIQFPDLADLTEVDKQNLYEALADAGLLSVDC